MTTDMIEWGGLLIEATFSLIDNRSGHSSLESFMITATVVPSGLRNAVVSNLSVVEELMIRFAP